MEQTFNLKGGIKYSTLPLYAKIFFTMFLLIMGAGYILALMNIVGNMGFGTQGIIYHYAGSTEDPIGYPPMDFPTMATVTHTHMIAMGTMAFLIGWVFLFTQTLSDKLKGLLYFFYFGAIFADICSIWLVRYVTTAAVYLMILAGASVGLCIAIMIGIPLFEMWLQKES